MVLSFLNKFYSDFSREELKKFIYLGAIFAFTIGIYWFLRPMKDGLFITVSGGLNIPAAKILSLFVVVPLAIMYSAIVDRVPRHKIFYVLCGIYGTLALLFAYFFSSPIFGLGEGNLETFVVNGKEYSQHVTMFGRVLGWCWYSFVESFGSLMVVLFWGFAADTTKPDSAKRGFGIVAMGAQLGGIAGPLIVMTLGERLGEPTLMVMACAAIFTMGFMIYGFMRSIPKEQLEGYKAKGATSPKKKTGLLEGFKLLISQPYLLSIFGVISIFEIVNTIFDFKLKMLASTAYKGPALTVFLAKFGVIVNAVALFSLALGISTIGRKIGVKKSLLMLPVLVMGGVIVIYFLGSFLWPVLYVNAALKALNYAFNQPTKEQLYIPTTKDTKYKAKAWTEMFGNRGSKVVGSGINMLMAADIVVAVSLFGLIGVWFVAAGYAGSKHKEAIDTDSVVC